MDDGEIEFSGHEAFFSEAMSDSVSMESFFDDLLKNTHACTHMHSCNPPGPDNTHTHTCIHTHTKLFASPEGGEEEEDKSLEGGHAEAEGGNSSSRKKRPLGNREAVRKYREKKKAHTAYLEEQVHQLRLINEQLVKRVRGQAALEAEAVRLRTLLVEFKGRIDAELYPYPQPCLGGPNNLYSKPGIVGNSSVNLACLANDVPCPWNSAGEEELNHRSKNPNLACLPD